MTYFCESAKNLETKLNKDKLIGPGSYSNDKKESPHHSYAPFGSRSKKNVNVKKQIGNNIGPGAYEINRELIQPSILKYQNDKCIIIKVNNDNGCQFKSKLERFTGACNTLTPGPGSYLSHQNPQFNNRRRTKSVGKVAKKMKQLFNSQYKQKRKPTLFSDPIIVKESKTKTFEERTKGGVQWHLNQRERFKTEPQEVFRPEDQSKIIDDLRKERKINKNNRYSSFFASNSAKSCFDQIIYKTTNPLKIQVRKMMGYSDSSPGPGSYQIHNKSASQIQSQKHQFFGTTEQRFKSQQSDTNDIGPGQYYSQNKSRLSSQKNKIKKPVREHKKKDDENENDQTFQSNNVGPGYYQISKKEYTHNTRLLNGEGSFGFHGPRFTQKNHTKEIGKKKQQINFMAQEDVERKKKIQEAMQERKKLLESKQNCMFVSETKRNCFADCQYRQDLPFGIYEVGSEDIGKRIEKKKEYQNQIAQCNFHKPGFMSAVERFKNKKQEVGGHKDCWCQIRDVQKRSIEHMSPAFQSKQKRSQLFGTKNNGPSIGQYFHQSTLVKQSFNSKFIKQNQNKAKKLKFWKTKDQNP